MSQFSGATYYRGKNNYRGRGRSSRGRFKPRNDKYFTGTHKPGKDENADKIFDFSYLLNLKTIDYVRSHGRILFFVRGPPGTAKDSLKLLLFKCYSEAALLSAKDYSDSNFEKATKLGAPEYKAQLDKAHKWCKKRLEEKMATNSPCIILSNTHVTQWEVEHYMSSIKSYSYTVIMVETPWKFSMDASGLVSSNKQGLNKNYIDSRLKTWCHYQPWYTGWFLNPADSTEVINNGFEICDLILREADFGQNMKLNSIMIAADHFSKEMEIFCICYYCKSLLKQNTHYFNKKVIDSLGNTYPLHVHAYVINSSHILALVKLTEEQVNLCSIDSISSVDKSDESAISKGDNKQLPLENVSNFEKSENNVSYRKDPKLVTDWVHKNCYDVSGPSEEIKHEGFSDDESECSYKYASTTYSTNYKSKAQLLPENETESSLCGSFGSLSLNDFGPRNCEYAKFDLASITSKSTSEKIAEVPNFKCLATSPNNLGLIVIASDKTIKGKIPYYEDAQNYISSLFKEEGMNSRHQVLPNGNLYIVNDGSDYVYVPNETLNFTSLFTGLY